jgi:hypothetical protein
MDEPLINIDEAVEHAGYAVRDIVEFTQKLEPTDYNVEDFIAAAHNLSAILRVLEYSTVQANFNELVKSL